MLNMLFAFVIISGSTQAVEPWRVLVDPSQIPHAGVVGSLEEALSAAREAPEGTPRVDIELKPGLYEIQRPLRIDNPGRVPLRIHGTRGCAGATILIGGARLAGLPRAVAEDDSIGARLPGDARPRVRCLDTRIGGVGVAQVSGPVRHGIGLPVGAGSELFCNGAPLTPARWPHTGFADIDGVVDPGTSKDTMSPEDLKLRARAGTFRFADRAKLERWAGVVNVWLSGYWNWDWADDTMPAGKIDAQAGTISLGLPHTYGLGQHARFFVTNVPEELDAPGEYWIDPATGRVYVWLPDNAGESPELIVSLLADPIITIQDAGNLEIADLTFAAGRGCALRLAGAENVLVERCAFRNMGTAGVELEGRQNTVRECTFEDLGASGITVAGGDRATLTHAGNQVLDCTFRRCARTHRTYQPAIRLDGVGQVVANNLVEDLPHCALILAGNEHRIERNDISRVLLETGDSGAIYCGRDWTLHGTVIRNNLFHDIVGTDARYQNAVYLDDMASGITVEGNIFERCHWGMLIGGGRDILVRGNIFDSCAKGLSFDKRGVGWMAKNIADPAKSTLHERLRAVPIDKEPWRSRYPTLQEYLTDRFGRPVGGRVVGNLFLGTPLGRVDDRECVLVENNVESKQAMSADEVAAILDPVRRRALKDFKPESSPVEFAPIPVKNIGPGGGSATVK